MRQEAGEGGVMPEKCPFCKHSAAFREADRDELDMDCRNCLIEVTFVDTATAAMQCQNPANALEYIRDWMRRGVSRPVVTSVVMQR
jgi:hypothetical protein